MAAAAPPLVKQSPRLSLGARARGEHPPGGAQERLLAETAAGNEAGQRRGERPPADAAASRLRVVRRIPLLVGVVGHAAVPDLPLRRQRRARRRTGGPWLPRLGPPLLRAPLPRQRLDKVVHRFLRERGGAKAERAPSRQGAPAASRMQRRLLMWSTTVVWRRGRVGAPPTHPCPRRRPAAWHIEGTRAAPGKMTEGKGNEGEECLSADIREEAKAEARPPVPDCASSQRPGHRVAPPGCRALHASSVCIPSSSVGSLMKHTSASLPMPLMRSACGDVGRRKDRRRALSGGQRRAGRAAGAAGAGAERVRWGLCSARQGPSLGTSGGPPPSAGSPPSSASAP